MDEASALTNTSTGGDGYRYDTFRTRDMLADLRFGPRAVNPGESFSPVTLSMTNGESVTIGGERNRPMVVVTGSLTCPMTEASTPSMQRLHEEYGTRMDFLMVSGREAHPGERLPQPKTDHEARVRAEELASFHQVPFAVAVDTLDGAVHQHLDLKPNTLVVLDETGTVVFRSLWAGDHRHVRSALDAVVAGRTPARRESRAVLGPMSGALPRIREVTQRGGSAAWSDVRRSAPPMAMMAWLAARMPFGSRRLRGAVAMVAPAVVMAAVGIAFFLMLGASSAS
jgi:hypothetical protein